jgi:hypothetical protein
MRRMGTIATGWQKRSEHVARHRAPIKGNRADLVEAFALFTYSMLLEGLRE